VDRAQILEFVHGELRVFGFVLGRGEGMDELTTMSHDGDVLGHRVRDPHRPEVFSGLGDANRELLGGVVEREVVGHARCYAITV